MDQKKTTVKPKMAKQNSLSGNVKPQSKSHPNRDQKRSQKVCFVSYGYSGGSYVIIRRTKGGGRVRTGNGEYTYFKVSLGELVALRLQVVIRFIIRFYIQPKNYKLNTISEIGEVWLSGSVFLSPSIITEL